ncbi:MAG TPA: ATP-dependent protease LonB [Bacillota bacterium]|nr:ATP-dependent protease LonB [Bacillota bacterium]HPX68459.1 ATP-dependent protease LonB [Bacillota bacterium]HQO42776.1 ATP-dependent protease LonB [Bacillota bacterium]HQQ44796.1 ATP-dependent protease LonB [Bacillota bacterium]
MSQLLIAIQLFFAVVIGMYFLNLLRGQQGNKVAIEKESRKEMEKLQHMRDIQLTKPLSEITRPSDFREIIGQENGIKALRAAICSPNPQHVIIYGPPGIGKTAAARLILEEAKKTPNCPFRQDAKFVEVDATTVRFDERGIADPLIGSVHDPIYQGAGAMGVAGIPQPKVGAVTKAHGGILFIDEIGELHPIQMNKLLKVLEDRKVFLESAYYSSEDANIPFHIHDIFQNGLPADFRLIGATTRGPESIPPALRSRCLEIYFRALTSEEIGIVTSNALNKIRFECEEGVPELIGKYATNGREAVNIIQTAVGVNINEKRNKVTISDIEWVLNNGQYSPRPERKINDEPQIGYVNGLAVYGPNMGTLMEIEAIAVRAGRGTGRLLVTGIVEEEEIGSRDGRTIKRKSMAKASTDNVITAIKKYLGIDPGEYDIHLNFPGGTPVDGPSAGITIAVAIYSAITNSYVDNRIAMTGEVSIRGKVKGVGGIIPKIEAAVRAGVKKVIIPKENWQEIFSTYDIEVISVESIVEAVNIATMRQAEVKHLKAQSSEGNILTASKIAKAPSMQAISDIKQ